MPRYFFHVEDGRSFPDLDGVELPDLDAARIEAVRLLGGMLRDEAETFWQGDDWRMSVADAGGMALFTIDFMATMAPVLQNIRPPRAPARAGSYGAETVGGGTFGRLAEA